MCTLALTAAKDEVYVRTNPAHITKPIQRNVTICYYRVSVTGGGPLNSMQLLRELYKCMCMCVFVVIPKNV